MSSHLSPRPSTKLTHLMQVEVALVHMTDETGRLTYVSDGWLAALGYTAEEALQLNISQVVDDESLSSYQQHLTSLMQGMPLVVARLVLRARGGGRIAVSGHLSASRARDGSTGTLAVLHDDTALSMAAAAAQQADESLRLALDSVEDGLWDWAPATGRLDTTLRWASMLGYDSAELDSHISVWERLCHPDDLPGLWQRLNAHLEGRSPGFECEHRLRRKDGTWAWVLARAKVVKRDANGTPIRVVGTNVDVSDRKSTHLAMTESEERAREAEAELRALFAAMHDVVIILDRWGTYLKVIPTAQELLLIPLEQIVGKRLHDLFPREDADLFAAVLARALSERRVVAH